MPNSIRIKRSSVATIPSSLESGELAYSSKTGTKTLFIGTDGGGIEAIGSVEAVAHPSSSHAPVNAQKNSDITKQEIEDKLTGELTSHSHAAAEAGNLYSDGSVPMDIGYSPSDVKDIVTKEYVDNLASPTPFQFDYKWKTGSNTTVDEKQVGTDNADVTLTTKLLVHKSDRLGRDMSLVLGVIGSGDWFNIHEHDNSGDSYSFDILSSGTLNGDVFEFDASYYASSAGGTIANRDRVDIFWQRSHEPVDQPLLANGTIDLVPGYSPVNSHSVATRGYVDDELDSIVTSIGNEATGENVIENMVAITQADYDAIGTGNYGVNTLYIIIFE